MEELNGWSQRVGRYERRRRRMKRRKVGQKEQSELGVLRTSSVNSHRFPEVMDEELSFQSSSFFFFFPTRTRHVLFHAAGVNISD